jgi:hypothetical protein
MSKKYDAGSTDVLDSGAEDVEVDAEFLTKIDLLKQEFVASVAELQKAHEQHLIEEFIRITSNVNASADTIMEEVLNFELLKDLGDNITMDESDVKRLAAIGIKLNVKSYPSPFKIHLKQALEEVANTASLIMSKGKEASEPLSSATTSAEMLRSIIPCGVAVKKLINLAKDATAKVKLIGSEERRKKEEWKKECLANERVKKMFQMWETQVIGDVQSSNKMNYGQLAAEEHELLNETTEGLVLDENTKQIKGGRLAKLVEYVTSHVPNSGKFKLY